MCNCNKLKKGLSEILSIAKKFAEIQKTNVIVYEHNEKYDFSDEKWFPVHEHEGAKKIYKIEKNGQVQKL